MKDTRMYLFEKILIFPIKPCLASYFLSLVSKGHIIDFAIIILIRDVIDKVKDKIRGRD